jgi:hypothetical protein
MTLKKALLATLVRLERSRQALMQKLKRWFGERFQ